MRIRAFGTSPTGASTALRSGRSPHIILGGVSCTAFTKPYADKLLRRVGVTTTRDLLYCVSAHSTIVINRLGGIGIATVGRYYRGGVAAADDIRIKVTSNATTTRQVG